MVAMSCSLQSLLLASLLWTGLCQHHHAPDPEEFKAAFHKAFAEQLHIPMEAFRLPVQHSAHKLHHPQMPSTWMHHPSGFYGPAPQHSPPSMMHHPPHNPPPFMMHQPPHGLAEAEEELRHMHGLPGVGKVMEEDLRQMPGLLEAEKRVFFNHKLQNMLGGPEPPPGTKEVLELNGPGMPRMPGGPMVFTDGPPPVQMMRALFPGPLHLGGQPMPGHAMPFADPDPVVLDMLGTVDHVMRDVMTPGLHSMGSASQAPASCHADLQKHCPKARSQVHCLGLHSEDISEPCEKDVGKSVPFVCSHAINELCDVLQGGILDCLKGQLGKLEMPCKDAVLTTSKALSHLNGLRPQALAGPGGAVPPAVQHQLDGDGWKPLDGWKNTNQMLNKEEEQIQDLILHFQNKHGPHEQHHHYFWYLVVAVVLVLIYLHLIGSDFGHAASSFFTPHGEPLLKEASPISKEFDQLV